MANPALIYTLWLDVYVDVRVNVNMDEGERRVLALSLLTSMYVINTIYHILICRIFITNKKTYLYVYIFINSSI